MQERRIKTKIWRDNWFANLDHKAKLLFIYLVTNEYMGLSGIAEIPERTIMFDTNLTLAEINQAKTELAEKVVFVDDWVYVMNLLKHDPIRGEKNTLKIALDKELQNVPKEILNKLMGDRWGIDGRIGIGIGTGKGIGNEYTYGIKDSLADEVADDVTQALEEKKL